MNDMGVDGDCCAEKRFGGWFDVYGGGEVDDVAQNAVEFGDFVSDGIEVGLDGGGGASTPATWIREVDRGELDETLVEGAYEALATLFAGGCDGGGDVTPCFGDGLGFIA